MKKGQKIVPGSFKSKKSTLPTSPTIGKNNRFKAVKEMLFRKKGKK